MVYNLRIFNEYHIVHIRQIDPNRSFPFEAMEERFINSGMRRRIGCVEVK